jgi:hypothetical protein
MIDGEPVLNAEIAQISGMSPGLPRFEAGMSSAEANSFSNLLLLCKAHHAVVDRNSSNQYTTNLLQAWKREREASLNWSPPERIFDPEPSRGLREAAERHMQDLLSESYEAARCQIDDALTEFEKFDAQAADSLRTLLRNFPNIGGA